MEFGGPYDVVVVGGGNAALCAAPAGAPARRQRAHHRGGADPHARRQQPPHAQRALHAHGPAEVLVGDYAEDEFCQDLLQVTGGETDEKLARLTHSQPEQTCGDG